MKSISVYHFDAFSKEPNKGNPAGVVFNADPLSDEEMQEIALKVGFNETAFALNSEVADVRIRYFTPGHETNLCGHATMATVCGLYTKGFLGDKKEFTIETKAGILPIKIATGASNEILITMRQASPQFVEFKGSRKDLAHSLGLVESDLHEDFPIVYGSTGAWTLIVPIQKLESFNRMTPNNKTFPEILKEMPTASVHPFCLETFDVNAQMHARHFSAPYSGTLEDPVTGTASGVMGAYCARYIKHGQIDELNLIVEQGQEIGKDGRVMVHISKNADSYDVEIIGTAIFVKNLDVSIEG
ncbi:PhzF family phenazine biosynthesis isomerase [Lysinibacillus endophyticus]|uniref:PhzF family phenazine biosynthesis isomerase n=1 Tax=Ureibacillus endophyticus TaxID=1978490 RepID=UPI00209D3353|nr:PhzF family phenazine biosynthesis isomerase [Lysinibacillus endophyticus]MCP1144892.1 PhzF family phenazine biosynthesis isomerase [Lysinibacillus endophyticus]